MMRFDGERVGVITTSYPRAPDDPAGSFVAAHVDWLRGRGLLVDVVCAGDWRRPHQQWQDGVRVFPVRAGNSPPRKSPGLVCCSARKLSRLVCCGATNPQLFYSGGAPDMLEHMFLSSMNTRASLCSTVSQSFTTYPLHFMHKPRNVMNPACFLQLSQAALQFFAVSTSVISRLVGRWNAIFTHWLLPSFISTCLANAIRFPFRSHRPPLVAIAHSGDVHLIHKLQIASLVARLLRARQSKLVFVSQALMIRFVSCIHNRELVHWVRQNSVITPMGIDTEHFGLLRRHTPDQERDSPFRILFLGRLVPIKGVDVLLRAITRPAFQPQTGVHITIAGDGPSRPALERAAVRATMPAMPIEFTGEVGAPQRDRLLARADVVVIPSLPRPDGRTEGMPVTALEAMASGVPLIASRTGGLADLPADVATLLRPGDPDALATALTMCACSPGDFKRQADAAQRYAARFSWTQVGPLLWPEV